MEFIGKECTSAIKKGDVVWLKSGGPEMTVHLIDEDGNCTCLWFRHGEIQRYSIEHSSLTKKNPFYLTEKKPIRGE
jgi:uncharacterized protein YodC (DUF2158 family)